MSQEEKMKRMHSMVVLVIMTLFLSGTAFAGTHYIIKKGDNPSTIAKKFHVSSRDIIKANNLRSGNLKPGTKITIPSKGKTSSRENESAGGKDKRTVTATRSKGSSIHIVKKGDSLFSLSKKYSTSVSELKDLNNIRSSSLKPGQRIIVKKAGHTAYAATKYDATHQLEKLIAEDTAMLEEIHRLDTDASSPAHTLSAEYEGQETKTYDAIISQAFPGGEIETASPSHELSDMGIRERLILFAKKLLDIPYRFGGNSLIGIDCSAYVQKVYNVIGVSLPRSAREQFTEGNPVDKEELSIGDLVFFKTYASFPSHVGIYLGNNLFIHASSRSKKVTIDSLETPYYFKRFIGAKRVIDGRNEIIEPQKEG
jgi:peptidoglycan DL-endopeptidase LytE